MHSGEAVQFEQRLQDALELIDANFCRRDQGNPSTHLIVDHVISSSDLADVFDEDLEVNIVEIQGHKIVARRSLSPFSTAFTRSTGFAVEPHALERSGPCYKEQGQPA